MAAYASARVVLCDPLTARQAAGGATAGDRYAQRWFSRLLERSGVVYAADSDADPFDPAIWEAANPSLVHLPELRKVYQREAAEAAADPSLLPAFRALRCNMGAVDHEIAVLIEAADWQRCEADILPQARGPAVWGIDLSGGDGSRCNRLLSPCDGAM